MPDNPPLIIQLGPELWLDRQLITGIRALNYPDRRTQIFFGNASAQSEWPFEKVALTLGLISADQLDAMVTVPTDQSGDTDQLQALRDTVAAAERAGMPLDEGSDTGLDHLRTMLATVEAGQFSPTKLGRWLGWPSAPSWWPRSG